MYDATSRSTAFSTSRPATLAVVGGALLAAVSMAITFATIRVQTDNAQWVAHTIEVRRQIAELGWEVRAAGSGFRLYLLTHADSHLDTYREALDHVPKQLAELAERTSDNPVQRHNLEILRPLVAERFDRLTSSLQGAEPTAEWLQGSKLLLDKIRAVEKEMDAEEERLLVVRLAKAKRDERIAEVVLSVGLTLSLGLVLLGWWLQRLELRRELLLTKLLQIGSHVSNTSTAFRESLQRCLDEICGATGWTLGHAHVLEGGKMVSSGIWHMPPGRDLSALRASMIATAVEPGEGLSGRVMVSREPSWFGDLTTEAPVAEHQVARDEVVAAGYRGVFGLPVLTEGSVPAVLEFFCERPVAPERALFQVLAAIGAQLGRVYEREAALALQEAHAREIAALSMTDELTGLLNRRGFLAMARQQLKLSRRSKENCLLLFMDMDGLKQINDQLGHAAGDDALKQMAAVVRRSLRESDLAARLGGDEFVALLPTARGADDEITRRIQDNLRGSYAAGAALYPLRISIGARWIEPSECYDVEELLEAADRAMYQKKKQQRLGVSA